MNNKSKIVSDKIIFKDNIQDNKQDNKKDDVFSPTQKEKKDSNIIKVVGNKSLSNRCQIKYNQNKRNTSDIFSNPCDAILSMSDKEISDRITPHIVKDIIKNKFNVYVINIKERIDRKTHILDETKNQKIFNMYFFDAIKNSRGFIGCGGSHRCLIKYAKTNNLPYIIVMEDDNIFVADWSTIEEIITWLTDNLDKWDIFNSNPTFGGLEKPTLIKYPTDNENLCVINWGQTTNFMIYNKSSYDKMLLYKMEDHIDLYIPRNFLQICPLPYITSQECFYSDITKITADKNKFNAFFNNAQKRLQNLEYTALPN
jgi:glycosyl transferase family 25